MERSFELQPVEGGWKLTLYEDGDEAGGGRGTDDDYNDLYQAGEEFTGVEQSSVRP